MNAAAKVGRSALDEKNAARIASLLLTTDAMVSSGTEKVTLVFSTGATRRYEPDPDYLDHRQREASDDGGQLHIRFDA